MFGKKLYVSAAIAKQLVMYNCVGFQNEIFEWMYNEATRLKIPKEGHVGGIILKEMSI